jgi:hypothetical protein
MAQGAEHKHKTPSSNPSSAKCVCVYGEITPSALLVGV